METPELRFLPVMGSDGFHLPTPANT